MKRFFLVSLLMMFGFFASIGSLKAQELHWTFSTTTYSGYNGLQSVIKLDGTVLQAESTNLELGAFCGDECRGSCMPTFLPFGGGVYFYMLPVWGEPGHTITFKIYDHSTNSEVAAVCSTVYNWVSDGDMGNPVNPYEIEFTSIPSYTITVSANPTAGGTVTGGGTFLEGESCTVTATAASGYNFINWTKGSTVVSTDATYTFTVSEDAALVANFATSHTVTVSANPTAGGTVTGGGTYQHGENCTVTATANTGYNFVNWTNGSTVVSTNPSYTFAVNEDVTLVANFAAVYTVTVTVSMSEAGTVAGAGSFTAGETCTLTATANAGYSFLAWTTTDDVLVSTSNPYTFTVTGNVSLKAVFSAEILVITPICNPSHGGTITMTGATEGENGFHYNDPCTLTAAPATNFVFDKWTDDDFTNVLSTNATYTFNVTAGANIYAHFTEQAGTSTVTAVCDPTTAGTITGAGNYTNGTSCTLTVTPNAGYEFTAWMTTDDVVVSTANPYTFTVTGNVSLKATFSYEVLVITPICNPSQGGSIAVTGATEGDFGFHLNDPCTLTATANAGYDFVKWTRDDFADVLSTDAAYTFNVIEGGNYYAHFIEQTGNYTVTTVVTPTGAGTVTGDGTYAAGASCTLTATANTGYDFWGWTTMDDIPVSTDNPYTFTVTENVNLKAVFSAEVYTINTFSVPSMGGTIAVAGATEGDNGFHFNDPCTLTATPATGYTFLKWTNDDYDVVISTDATFTFNVTAGGNYFAHFVLGTTTYTVTTTVNPEGAGTVTGGGTFNPGETCTLTATANEGYDFWGWTTMDDVPVSTENPYSFTVTSDVNLKAVFMSQLYNITASASPSFGGSVYGTGAFFLNQTCTLIAVPNDGYVFVNWTLNGIEVSTDPAYSFTVVEAGDYVANFVEGVTVTITVDGEGGTVTGAGTYLPGETVTIGAIPNPGYSFDYWEIGTDMITDNPYIFTATTDVNIIAHFTLDVYTIVAYANPTGGGTVTQSGTTFNYGQSCTLTAVPAENYSFVNWTKDGVEVSTDAVYTFPVTESGTYMANFIQGFMITAECDPETAGTITGAGAYNDGETCTLTAVAANEHFAFAYWTMNGVQVGSLGNPTYTFTVTESAHFVAHFAYDEFIINAYANPSFAGETSVSGGIDGTNTFIFDQVCTLTAVANYGYTFQNWTLNGIEVSTSATYSFNVTESGDYMANFVENEHYTIYVEAAPADGGEVAGGGEYYVGEVCTITATPNPGFSFNCWTLNGVVVSTDAIYSFTVTEEATYVANFSSNLYYIAVDVTPAIGGEVAGVIPGAFYPYGHWCILEAIPNPGYSFSYWTMDGVWYSADEYITFIVTADHDMVAHFTQDGYYISAIANPYEGGYTTGSGTYTFGETCTLTATANAGYTFVNWTLDGVVVSTNTSINFVVREDANYVANFEQNLYEITVEANPANAAYVFIQNGQDGYFTYGQSCTLRVATPNAGYTFVNWTLNGVVVSTTPTYTFTVTGNANFVANFSVETFTINATAVPAIGGIVTGGGQYEHGQTCTLTATPRNGYTFLRWYKNGVVVSTDPTYTFTVTGNGNYVAQFTNRAVYITATISTRDEAGVITGAGVYEEGETVTLNVIPNGVYNFIEWQENGKQYTTEQQFSIVAEYDRSFVAILSETTDVNENNGFMVTVYPNPAVNVLTISTDQAEYQLDIFTITGALVRTMSNCSNATQINVEDLPAGSYIIRLTNGNIVESRRFVKK